MLNATASWPERLAHVSTLLRAEAAAILALRGSEVRTLFTSPENDGVPWHEVLDGQLIRRALDAVSGFATAIPASRWDAAGYALLAPLDAGRERGVLAAIRHGFPFDAVEVTAADAAARLLALAFIEIEPPAAPLLATVVGERIAERPPVAVPPPSRTLRVLLIEDHPATRIGLETIMSASGFEIVASAGSIGEAVARLGAVRCDLAIVDLSLPDATVTEGVERLRSASPGLSIVTYGDEDTADSVRAALRAGAIGHLGKDAQPSRIAAAIHAASLGLAPIEPGVLEAILEAPRPTVPAVPAPHEELRPPERPSEVIPREPLSPRDLELLRYMAEGYTNKEIARAMVLAEDTVKKGVQSVIGKLGAADRTHAVVIALRAGVIE